VQRRYQGSHCEIRTQLELLKTSNFISEVVTLLLTAPAAVSLAVGGIGIMNIMLVGVTERTRKVGMRRAVGNRRRSILIQFFLEAALLSGTGGALGVLMGLLPRPAVAQRPGPPPPRGPHGRRPPPPPSPGTIQDLIRRTQLDLAAIRPANPRDTVMQTAAHAFANQAQRSLNQGQWFAADRMAQAAEALSRALDRLEHRNDRPEPPPPPRDGVAQHLVTTYFRVRQASYFLEQFRTPAAKPLPGLARQFYQQARQAFDRNNDAEGEAYARSAEDVVRALELAAQATVPVPKPPPLP
jgi:hypothetical protein